MQQKVMRGGDKNEASADMLITLYSNFTSKTGQNITLGTFLNHVKEGHWQDKVFEIRTEKDREKRKLLKAKAPCVTISGTFKTRQDAALAQHSGFIAIDIDNLDNVEAVKAQIRNDKYIYAAFMSVGGRGLCLLLRIDGAKHREAFVGVGEYLLETYGLVIDQSGINVSRLRTASYDPDIYINDNAERFTKIPKTKDVRMPDVVFVKSDFDAIINEIESRRIDICQSYDEWLRIGFALASHFGEAGRQYFRIISQVSGSLSPDSQRAKPQIVERQYNNCLRAKKQGCTVSIATFYYFANKADIKTYSKQTKKLINTAYVAKISKKTKPETIQLLQDANGASPEESKSIADQVYYQKIAKPQITIIEQIEEWLKLNRKIERNAITRKIEVDGREMDDTAFNTIFCEIKKAIANVNADTLHRVIGSNFIPTYNPFFRFIEKHKHLRPSGLIRELFDSIESDTGTKDNDFFPDYVFHFGSRWLVSIVASIHGKHSPLMLVLSGSKQGTGKTEFFRRLLPPELQPYYAESKMDNEKDDLILICKMLIILDDEMSGKSKKEEKHMKELLSKQKITVREPYGRYSVDMNRIAVFCGTTNEEGILNDPTGNRRIIPINVLSIDFDRINKIDRTDLFMEAYHLYKAGFDWELTSHDIQMLNANTQSFQQPSPERELVIKNYDVPDQNTKSTDIRFATTTEIKVRLERSSQQTLSTNRIGQQLKNLGYVKKSKRIGGNVVNGYYVIEKTCV